MKISRQTDRFFIQDLYKVHRLYVYNRTYILSRDFIQKINKKKKYVRYTQKPQKAKLVVFKISKAFKKNRKIQASFLEAVVLHRS